MTHNKFTLGLIQMRCSADANLSKAVRFVHEAASGGAQIICLPELFRTPYFCQKYDLKNFDLAEPIPGPTSEALSAVAKETGRVVVGSIFERRTAGVYHN